VGSNAYNEYAEYRGKKDTVLMYVRKYGSDFTGLIGRHSTDREVTSYDEREDETRKRVVGDDDYPNAPFICMPRLGMIACVDSGQIKADAAMMRLHAILIFRQGVMLVVQAVTEPFDLRKAVRRFRLTEVTFEILPVNPHTKDLGLALDESRKKDHISKIIGTAHATPSNPMQLDGGFLTAVQQLQESGHSRVGFTGVTHDGKAEVRVPKPSKPRMLSSSSEETVTGENVDVRIIFPGLKTQYPFTQSHVTEIRTIARQFSELSKQAGE